MRIEYRRIAVAVAATVAAACVASTGTTQAISEEELADRRALADFQQVEKPGWDPVRFGELAAQFGHGVGGAPPQGFAPGAPAAAQTTYHQVPGVAADVHRSLQEMEQLLEESNFDAASFAKALAEHLDVWPD